MNKIEITIESKGAPDEKLQPLTAMVLSWFIKKLEQNSLPPSGSKTVEEITIEIKGAPDEKLSWFTKELEQNSLPPSGSKTVDYGSLTVKWDVIRGLKE